MQHTQLADDSNSNSTLENADVSENQKNYLMHLDLDDSEDKVIQAKSIKQAKEITELWVREIDQTDETQYWDAIVVEITDLQKYKDGKYDDIDEVTDADKAERLCNITILPVEPECNEWNEEHNWEEWTGPRGNGGGVILRDYCTHCGIYKTVDTWAQNPETGEQGLESTSYGDADESSLKQLAEKSVQVYEEGLKDELVKAHKEAHGCGDNQEAEIEFHPHTNKFSTGLRTSGTWEDDEYIHVTTISEWNVGDDATDDYQEELDAMTKEEKQDHIEHMCDHWANEYENIDEDRVIKAIKSAILKEVAN